ncbi:MAG: RluA family pseudouridine synthase [Bacilli bacterium]|nr:RluA family pseudouridine synthase [Bacilli bacterium]
MIEVKIEKASDGQKAEKFVKKYLSDAPLGFIYKAFRKKDIKANGHWITKDAVLHEGDVLRIYVTDKQLEDFKKPRDVTKAKFPYEIVYEDDNVLIVNKPKGLLVYGDEKGVRLTLGNAVLNYLYFSGSYDPNNASFTPSPAHRLDRNTSGLVAYGKTDAGLKALTDLFKTHEKIHKHYLALVVGDIEEDGEVNKPLAKDEETGMVKVTSPSKGGKTALTKYHVVKRYGYYTMVELDLITGRTHQIRVHMSSIGHPVVGDARYGDFSDCRKVKSLTGLTSQFLHAYKMSFDELDGVLSNLSNTTHVAPLPKQLETILNKLVK